MLTAVNKQLMCTQHELACTRQQLFANQHELTCTRQKLIANHYDSVQRQQQDMQKADELRRANDMLQRAFGGAMNKVKKERNVNKRLNSTVQNTLAELDKAREKMALCEAKLHDTHTKYEAMKKEREALDKKLQLEKVGLDGIVRLRLVKQNVVIRKLIHELCTLSTIECPITLEDMGDKLEESVIAPDGHLYDKAAYDKWVMRFKPGEPAYSPYDVDRLLHGPPSPTSPELCAKMRNVKKVAKEFEKLVV